jgi:bifunctional non-homologous end joining protein LigD
MDPEERRLAMAVEDHPYDYKDFEGIIPKGQYGGGTVIVWDEGTYEPATEEKLKDKAAKEHWMMSNYYKNALKITLHGHKLKGDFTFIKFKDDKYEGGWRLIKVNDQYATKEDILLKDKSVKSILTIEDMPEKEGAAIWQSNRESEKTEPPKSSQMDLKAKGIRKALPKSVKPMLCTSPKKSYRMKIISTR